MNSKSLGILIIAALVVAAAGGYWLGTTKSTPDGDTGISTSGPRQPLFYRNPMNPEVTSPVPAKDAMGMDYIPVYAADAEGAGRAGTVQIDPVTVQNIGVRTAEAERRSIGRTIQTVGRVDYDEQRLVQLHPKTEGWVEKLYVDTTGSPVKKDAMLLSLYSPQLVSTQQEYVLALRNLETLHASPFEDVRRGAKELVETALERLRLLDVPDHQITDLTNTLEVKKQLHIHSPANGIVINIGAREGQYVTPPTELYAIADLSKVWVYVDIYEDELPWIRVGDQATIKVRAVPGQTFRGRLSYIYPYAESKTRTIKVRMEFDNADLLLKPNMFADVTIDASAIPDVIVVPSEAIIRSGAREQVFIRRAEGVAPGEEVVVSAQFLIDSESKLREAAAKMQEVNHD
jgi:Cu(I)/Ag(I) efflux system membrane fusion protein